MKSITKVKSVKESKLDNALFSKIYGYEIKEGKDGELIRGGYIATSALDNGFYDETRNVFIRDQVHKETLDLWCDQINQGDPNASKVSVNHKQEVHKVGRGISGSAHVDLLGYDDTGKEHYGLYADTHVDKTYPNFNDVKYRVENEFLDSFSIEFLTKDLATGDYMPGAVHETQHNGGIIRTLLPGTKLQGWTLASKPLNPDCVMIKEMGAHYKKHKGDFMSEETKEDKKPEEKKPDEKEETKKESKEEIKVEGKTNDAKLELTETKEMKIGQDDYNKFLKFKEMEAKEQKEADRKVIVGEVKEELKEHFKNIEVPKGGPKINTDKEGKDESKEASGYRQMLEVKSAVRQDGSVERPMGIKEMFDRASAYAESKGMFKGNDWKTTRDVFEKKYSFSTNGRLLEFKGLGITTNLNTDTDYLLSTAELDDVFDPVVYNALNQETVAWNVIQKDDFSNKGNNQVQFKLKTAVNASRGFYTGNAVNLGNVTRLKYMTKFKKCAVGVEVDGDMVAAAGPRDVFAMEVSDSTDDLLQLMNQQLFAETGLETAAEPIGFEYITDSAGNTSLYNLTRSAANKLSPDSAGDTYINGASANLSITNLRASKRQAVKEGAKLRNLVYFGDHIQGDKLRGIYDAAQRLVPTSSRFGFEGMITFDGIPFFEDKDCNDDDVFLVDLESHRIAIWVPPTLEMLGKDGDSMKGFIKTYYAVYNRRPRAMVQIYANST